MLFPALTPISAGGTPEASHRDRASAAGRMAGGRETCRLPQGRAQQRGRRARLGRRRFRAADRRVARPPDLARPYASLADRDADWQLLLRRADVLHELIGLSDLPEDQWPAGPAARLRAAPDRRRAAFAAPRTLAHRVRQRASDLQRAATAASSQGGSTTVSDIDLRSAVYLAGRLLATLYGVTIGQVTP